MGNRLIIKPDIDFSGEHITGNNNQQQGENADCHRVITGQEDIFSHTDKTKTGTLNNHPDNKPGCYCHSDRSMSGSRPFDAGFENGAVDNKQHK